MVGTVATEEAAVVEAVPKQLYIGGEWRPGSGTLTVEDPSTGLPLCEVYGLVAYVFTRDLGRALRVVEALQTGMVGLNQGLVSNAAAPFGGIKQSGFGGKAHARASTSF
jgi:acyl-CoA reductase-like NAD-dependent aldehyde dehydrogenase